MSTRRHFIARTATLAGATVFAGPAMLGSLAHAQQPVTLLNVSYVPSREFYVDFN